MTQKSLEERIYEQDFAHCSACGAKRRTDALIEVKVDGSAVLVCKDVEWCTALQQLEGDRHGSRD
jgi:hypothetical protein